MTYLWYTLLQKSSGEGAFSNFETIFVKLDLINIYFLFVHYLDKNILYHKCVYYIPIIEKFIAA